VRYAYVHLYSIHTVARKALSLAQLPFFFSSLLFFWFLSLLLILFLFICLKTQKHWGNQNITSTQTNFMTHFFGNAI
jgi:hypothetical protein